MLSSPLYDTRALAAAFASLLTCMLLLGISAGPPLVDISVLRSLDSGAEVSTIGILVDARGFDSGTDALVLLDEKGAETLNVMVLSSDDERPSGYVMIGDRLLVTGQLSKTGEDIVVYSSYGMVSLLARSEEALSVALVCDNWQLFLWDEFSLRGVLLDDGSAGQYWLQDRESSNRLRLDAGLSDLSGAVGRAVVVSGVLVMDRGDMSLKFRVRTLAATA